MRLALTITLMLLLTTAAEARTIDRIVAFVDDYAITQVELDASYKDAIARQPSLTLSEVLDAVITRYLLLREARRAHIDYEDEDKAIAEFLSIKLRAAIRVNEAHIREFYSENMFDFIGVPYDQARDIIEQKLTDFEFQYRLASLVRELKNSSRIKLMEP